MVTVQTVFGAALAADGAAMASNASSATHGPNRGLRKADRVSTRPVFHMGRCPRKGM
jgi:hypothetical protein